METVTRRGRVRTAAEIVGVVAVVLSLVFVGVELQQNTTAQRAQTRQELANSWRDVLLTIAENPAVARSYTSMYTPGWGYTDSTLSAVDSLQAEWLMVANLRNLENVWLQFREGVVDEEVFNTYAFRGEMYRSEAFRVSWKSRWSNSFDSSFVRSFEEANGLR